MKLKNYLSKSRSNVGNNAPVFDENLPFVLHLHLRLRH